MAGAHGRLQWHVYRVNRVSEVIERIGHLIPHRERVSVGHPSGWSNIPDSLALVPDEQRHTRLYETDCKNPGTAPLGERVEVLWG